MPSINMPPSSMSLCRIRDLNVNDKPRALLHFVKANNPDQYRRIKADYRSDLRRQMIKPAILPGVGLLIFFGSELMVRGSNYLNDMPHFPTAISNCKLKALRDAGVINDENMAQNVIVDSHGKYLSPIYSNSVFRSDTDDDSSQQS